MMIVLNAKQRFMISPTQAQPMANEGIPALKGGGVNHTTGKSLPYHFHIHKYNWYKPHTWFKQTPIINP